MSWIGIKDGDEAPCSFEDQWKGGWGVGEAAQQITRVMRSEMGLRCLLPWCTPLYAVLCIYLLGRGTGVIYIVLNWYICFPICGKCCQGKLNLCPLLPAETQDHIHFLTLRLDVLYSHRRTHLLDKLCDRQQEIQICHPNINAFFLYLYNFMIRESNDFLIFVLGNQFGANMPRTMYPKHIPLSIRGREIAWVADMMRGNVWSQNQFTLRDSILHLQTLIPWLMLIFYAPLWSITDLTRTFSSSPSPSLSLSLSPSLSLSLSLPICHKLIHNICWTDFFFLNQCSFSCPKTWDFCRVGDVFLSSHLSRLGFKTP